MVRLAEAIRKSNHKKNKTGKYKNLIKDHGQNPAISKRALTHLSASPEDIYQGLINYMNEVGHHVKKGEPFDIQKGFRLLNVIISHPKTILDDLHPLTLRSVGSQDESLETHAANVSINAMIMGDGFGYPRTKQIELGAAALFHDIGMYRVPMTIRARRRRPHSS